MSSVEFNLGIPEAPLEGDLYVTRPWDSQLGPEFIEGIYNALRYSKGQKPHIFNASGRNYYIPLPRQIGPYDALQVAGGGNSDLGITTNSGVEDSIVAREHSDGSRIIVPPGENTDLFTSYTLYYENGEEVERTNVNPVGSYSSRSASRKIDQTKAAFGLLPARAAGVITPKYVGKFEYGIPDQFGEPQTAILMLVPSLGMRFDSKLLLPLSSLLAGLELPSGKTFSGELKPYYEAIIEPGLLAAGWAMGAIHRAGLVHHQLTPGNFDVLESGDKLVPYVTDWDTMTTPDDADMNRSRAIDMLVALQAASGVLKRLARVEAIDTKTAASLVIDTVSKMLKGYFEGRGGLYAKYVNMQDGVNIAVNGYEVDKSLDIIESWL